MADIFKNVNGEQIKLEGAELIEYNNLQQAWIDGALERKKRKLRNKRKPLLEEADWQIHKIEDAGGNSSSWRTYRQALRDITNSPDNPTWPTKPS
tara:strand:- start:41 stop:325 length:285 start_codon:yes stop_codon:yes gene_type:complete